MLVPAILWHALPTVIQYAFLLLFTVAQFALLFWFLSRGGVDVYYPDDIKTRFSDVWGQDHVLERVKENIIFLENPEPSRTAAATCRAASCSGARQAPARR